MNASKPLEEQTLKLLASQLSIKVTLPVEVHGVAVLGGSNYSLALESPDTKGVLARGDRVKLADLVALLLQRPGLQLRASVNANGYDADALKSSRLWLDVAGTLTRSRLKASQWSMDVAMGSGAPAAAQATVAEGAPAAPIAKAPAAPPPRGPIRCNFSVVQAF